MSLPASPHLLASVTVDLDKSVLLQMVLFGILVVVLKPLLFDPVLQLFASRERSTDGAKAEARAMQERAAELLGQYETEVGRIRSVAAAERDALRKETAALEASMLAEARAAAEVILSEGRTRIAAEVAELERELGERREALSQGIGARVLGRELSS